MERGISSRDFSRLGLFSPDLSFQSGSEEGVFWKGGLFKKAHFLEIRENVEILEILENPQTGENKGETGHFLQNSRESRDFRDSRDSSSEKTPLVMTPFCGPDSGSSGFSRIVAICP